MSQKNLSRKTALILFGIVLALLFANVLIKKFGDQQQSDSKREEISGPEISNIFFTALKNYGLSDDWISRIKIKNISGDSLFAAYKVRVPKNLPVHLLLIEMKNLFREYDLILNSEEIKPGSGSILKILSGGQLKLAAELIYDEKSKREHAAVAFLVYSQFTENDPRIYDLLKTPERFYLVFSPSGSSKKNTDVITEAGKRYAVLLDDNISELDYKLSGSYSEDRLKRSIREIAGTFYNAAFFIIDDESDLYESSKYPFIENEFIKRKIAVIRKSRLTELNSNNVNVEEKFHKYILMLGNRDEKILFVSPEEYSSLVSVIPDYRKVGYRFIYPGDMIIRKPSLH